MSVDVKSALGVVVALAVVAAFVGPAAALSHDPGNSDDHRQDGDHGAEEHANERADHAEDDDGVHGSSSATVRTDGNSSTYQHPVVVVGQDGGYFLLDCEGNVTTAQHECDKGGALDAGPVSVDYEGYNYGNPPAMYGGGGDEVTVTVGNRSAISEFDCSLRTDTLPQSCTVNGSSSEGGNVSLP